MRWGFGWELGPFEIWDAIGVREVLDAAGSAEPAAARRRAAAAPGATASATDALPPAGAGSADPASRAKDRSGVVKTNPGASLVDLGDGVLAVEFHSKMNAIGGDTHRRCCTPA